MAKIGLVTVLYKSDDVLEGFFKSISNQDYKDYILYLVDNSVNDVTDKLIAKWIQIYPITQYRHIKNELNTGVAAGNNTGAKKGISEGCTYIVFLNNDIEMEQDIVFSKLVSLCEQKGETMVVPKIYYYHSRKLWMAGGYLDTWRALGVHYGYNKKDEPKYNTPKYVHYAPTCFMIISKRVFETVGFVDEKYFAYYDDTDFVFRSIKAGFKLYYEPSVYILHKVSSSVGGSSAFYVYYSNRNKIYFIRKNLKGIKRWFAIFYTLVSRIFFYLKYDGMKRKKLIDGLRDGFRLSV